MPLQETTFKPSLLGKQTQSICLNGDLISLEEPCIMGILNVTPDSFFDGGAYTQEQKIVQRAEEILSSGAKIIDIGGYSSRPRASNISEEEELSRVLPAIRLILKNFPNAYISIDTFRAEVARAAVLEGACMVNDISGGSLDTDMFETVSRLNVPYVLMHMQGSPQNMHELTHYDDILLEILDYFQKKVYKLREYGQKDIILDFGFGFAKNRAQNYFLLNSMPYFEVLNLPLLVGVSRKSMIYKTLSQSPQEALNGTTVLNTVAVLKKASMLRVHDVKETQEIIQLTKQLKR